MRLPSCISSKSAADDTRTSPLLPACGHARTSTLIDRYHPWVESDDDAAAVAKVVKPDCVFCKVSKESGFEVIHEDEELIAFHDRSPRAKVHLLIIPRYHAADSVKTLTKNHIPMLDRMITLAHTLSRSLDPTTSPKLGFHIPPFSSVPHLHLHVLIPPYTFLGRLKYPVSRRRGDDQRKEKADNATRPGGKVKGWSWFVEAGQCREILAKGGSIKVGRS